MKDEKYITEAIQDRLSHIEKTEDITILYACESGSRAWGFESEDSDYDDLAELYGVETRRLNEQVRRNVEKFPEDFMFQLTKEEFENLKSQFATSRLGWRGRRKLPLVYTEHGALQAANVLNSEQANKMSVFIVRAFIRLREMALTNEKLSQKIAELERRVSDHDQVLIDLIREIRKLIETYA